jgi:hypothetical protein
MVKASFHTPWTFFFEVSDVYGSATEGL